jgi:hypothetical protein
MTRRAAAARRPVARADALHSDFGPERASVGTPHPAEAVGRFYDGVTPERPTRWRLFFAARPEIPAALRGTTASGKPKKAPPRLPPNINERRLMHPQVERKTIAYWRGLVPMEVRRQHGMRLLERARISAVVYRRSLGVADASGDAERIKPLVDGLVDAGVIKNDRRREVEYGEVSEQHIGYRGMGVLLIVEEV